MFFYLDNFKCIILCVNVQEEDKVGRFDVRCEKAGGQLQVGNLYIFFPLILLNMLLWVLR